MCCCVFGLESVFACEGESIEFDYMFEADDASFVTPVHVKGVVANKTGVVSLDAHAFLTTAPNALYALHLFFATRGCR